MTSPIEQKLATYESPEITIYRISFENIVRMSGEATTGILDAPTGGDDWSNE